MTVHSIDTGCSRFFSNSSKRRLLRPASMKVAIVAFLCTALKQQAVSFTPKPPIRIRHSSKTGETPRNIIVLQDEDQGDQEVTLQNKESNQTKPWDWNATSGRSIGSLIMQMQKQEEQLLSTTKGSSQSVPEIQAITLDAGNISATENIKKTRKEPEEKRKLQESKDLEDLNDILTSESLSTIAASTARELDDSVTWMVSTPSARRELLDSVKVLPLPSVYNTAANKQTTSSPKRQKTLRMPEYFGRISRDMRHLAVSIASSIENVEQWRTFCEEGNGGLMPLLECIREGALYINLHKQEQKQKDPMDGFLDQQQEESFLAACSSCRALRDLCAVSPELSAVITDGILRANAAWSTTTTSTSHRSEIFNQQQTEEDGANRRIHQTGNNLMHDFMTMLRYANEYSESSPKHEKLNNPFRRSRNRKGKPSTEI